MTHREVLQLLLISLFYAIFTSVGVFVVYGVLQLVFWSPRVIFAEFVVLWGICAWLTEHPNTSWQDLPKVKILTKKGFLEER